MFYEEMDRFFYLPVGLWLIQILMILFPTLFYQSYFKRKFQSKTQRKLGLILIYGLSILTCMAFPVSINEGFMLDFRYIPLILGFLYGGYQVGFPLLSIVIIFRFIIGGPGIYLTILICVVLLAIFHFTLHKYEKYDSHGKRTYAISLLVIAIIVFGFGTQFFDDQILSEREFFLWIVFSFLNIITMLATRHIHESLLELDKINFEVIEYERMHLLSQFSVSIAHKLQSPISKIQDSVEILQTTELPANKRFVVKEMIDELETAQNIIDDYLVLAKERKNQKVILNVHSELETMIHSVQSYAQMHDVELKFFPAIDRELSVKGDPTQFRYALLNLIKNGIEAIEENGVVEIAIHEMLDSIYILIEDNGKGMSNEEVNGIGAPTNSKKKNGTGLGTLVAFNILKSMGGKIEVTSQIGKGTTFSIILPKASG
jgi:two-component system, sporulation sensor kinase B